MHLFLFIISTGDHHRPFTASAVCTVIYAEHRGARHDTFPERTRLRTGNAMAMAMTLRCITNIYIPREYLIRGATTTTTAAPTPTKNRCPFCPGAPYQHNTEYRYCAVYDLSVSGRERRARAVSAVCALRRAMNAGVTVIWLSGISGRFAYMV